MTSTESVATATAPPKSAAQQELEDTVGFVVSALGVTTLPRAAMAGPSTTVSDPFSSYLATVNLAPDVLASNFRDYINGGAGEADTLMSEEIAGQGGGAYASSKNFMIIGDRTMTDAAGQVAAADREKAKRRPGVRGAQPVAAPAAAAPPPAAPTGLDYGKRTLLHELGHARQAQDGLTGTSTEKILLEYHCVLTFENFLVARYESPGRPDGELPAEPRLEYTPSGGNPDVKIADLVAGKVESKATTLVHLKAFLEKYGADSRVDFVLDQDLAVLGAIEDVVSASYSAHSDAITQNLIKEYAGLHTRVIGDLHRKMVNDLKPKPAPRGSGITGSGGPGLPAAPGAPRPPGSPANSAAGPSAASPPPATDPAGTPSPAATGVSLEATLQAIAKQTVAPVALVGDVVTMTESGS